MSSAPIILVPQLDTAPGVGALDPDFADVAKAAG